MNIGRILRAGHHLCTCGPVSLSCSGELPKLSNTMSLRWLSPHQRLDTTRGSRFMRGDDDVKTDVSDTDPATVPLGSAITPAAESRTVSGDEPVRFPGGNGGDRRRRS